MDTVELRLARMDPGEKIEVSGRQVRCFTMGSYAILDGGAWREVGFRQAVRVLSLHAVYEEHTAPPS